MLNTLKEFMKCRLDNFSMGFILFYVNLSICDNKNNSHEYAGTVKELHISILPWQSKNIVF